MLSGRAIRNASVAAVAILIIGFAALYFAVRASLPQLEGEIRAPQLAAPASIERDAQGTPTLRATSRRDLAFATGFAHAQDRYFQMDLMRRAAAGELAELLGDSLIDSDKKASHSRIPACRSARGRACERGRARPP